MILLLFISVASFSAAYSRGAARTSVAGGWSASEMPSVRIANTSFSYPGGKAGIFDLSLDIHAE